MTGIWVGHQRPITGREGHRRSNETRKRPGACVWRRHLLAGRDDLDTGRVPVVVVDEGWTDMVDRNVEGYVAGALFQPWVVLRRASGWAGQDTIEDELVHFLSRRFVGDQPTWLAEGLATYFETAEEDGDLVTVGRPRADLLRFVQRLGIMPVDGLFAVAGSRSACGTSTGHDGGSRAH